MIYKIQKSLGNVSALLVENVLQEGICIEFKNFAKSDASIIIYSNGKPEDVCINGYTFPCVYNNLECNKSDDIFGGKCFHSIEFEFLAPDGSLNKIYKDDLYGAKESLTVEYFYSLLYNISCCSNVEQYKQLYEYIIDNRLLACKSQSKALKILNFIENFTSRFSNIQQDDFLPGLKQKISIKYKEAQEVIQKSNCPN